MDFYIDLALSVLLRVLRDKKQSQQIRRALLKVFKATLAQFGTDSEFIDAARPYVTDTEV